MAELSDMEDQDFEIAFSFDWKNVPPTTGNIASLSLKIGNNTISGPANISNVTYNAPVDGIVNGSADCIFTGEVTVS